MISLRREGTEDKHLFVAASYCGDEGQLSGVQDGRPQQNFGDVFGAPKCILTFWIIYLTDLVTSCIDSPLA